LLRRARLDTLRRPLHCPLGAAFEGVAIALLRFAGEGGRGKGGKTDRHGQRRDPATAQECCN
jgi:hypothetical protein